MVDQRDLFEPPPDPDDHFERGMRGSARAARKYTDDQKRKLMQAIHTVASTIRRSTTEDVWALANAWGVPRSKAIGVYMNKAKRNGWITQDGQRFCDVGGDGDHAQRLVVWRSLLLDGDAK